MFKSIKSIISKINFMNGQIIIDKLQAKVLQDEKTSKEYNGQKKEERILKVYQQGNDELLKVKVPLEYKRQKPDEKGLETFSGVFYYSVFRDKLYGTLVLTD
jgi:hypothetical protein